MSDSGYRGESEYEHPGDDRRPWMDDDHERVVGGSTGEQHGEQTTTNVPMNLDALDDNDNDDTDDAGTDAETESESESEADHAPEPDPDNRDPTAEPTTVWHERVQEEMEEAGHPDLLTDTERDVLASDLCAPGRSLTELARGKGVPVETGWYARSFWTMTLTDNATDGADEPETVELEIELTEDEVRFSVVEAFRGFVDGLRSALPGGRK
jgi:hypothetical protein